MKILLPGAIGPVLLLGLLLLGSCGPRLNRENWARIKNGMSEKEVTAVLGTPHHAVRGQTLNITGLTLYYESGGREVKVVLLNDAVIATEGRFP